MSTQYTPNFFLKEIQLFYEKTGIVPLRKHFPWSASAIRHYGTWDKVILAAGLTPRRYRKYSREFFVQEVQKYYRKFGMFPTRNKTTWSSSAIREFGSWSQLIREVEAIEQGIEEKETYTQTFITRGETTV